MNKVEEQAKLVQDALRAGKIVAVMVPTIRLFERLRDLMIPADLKLVRGSGPRYNHKFVNGARLHFVPSYQPDSTRGVRWDLAFCYHGKSVSPIDQERERRTWNALSEHAEMHQLTELP